MDPNSILLYLQQHSVSLSQLIYSGASVSVYKGQWQNCVAAVKILALEPIDDYTRMERECSSMIRLQHRNIVKIYDCFWCSNGLRYYLVIVVEWCNKDVMKDIHERRNAQFPWAEDKLWYAFKGMVSALAYMQREGFAHRDIKPQNLFIASENLIKIGDFGSGRFTEYHQNFAKMTLVGTPFFLSPLLKQNLIGNRRYAIHNVFKSDVYSLGLTLLLMTSHHDQNALATAIMQPASLWEVIQAIPYSDSLKSMLGWMLQYEESDRCDFVQLSQWLGIPRDEGILDTSEMNEKVYTCMRCGREIDSTLHTVILECDPTHQFCSQYCFDSFLRLSSPTCPKCNCPISSSFQQRTTASIADLYRSSEQVNAVNCLHCCRPIDENNPQAWSNTVKLSCEPTKHVFCNQQCLSSYMKLGNANCPICNVNINPRVQGSTLGNFIPPNESNRWQKSKERGSLLSIFGLCCGPKYC